MTLKLSNELDETNRIHCFLAGWVAYDPETRRYLYKSSGQRMAGRKVHYYLCQQMDTYRAALCHFTAQSDAEAVEFANRTKSEPQP